MKRLVLIHSVQQHGKKEELSCFRISHIASIKSIMQLWQVQLEKFPPGNYMFKVIKGGLYHQWEFNKLLISENFHNLNQLYL